MTGDFIKKLCAERTAAHTPLIAINALHKAAIGIFITRETGQFIGFQRVVECRERLRD